MGESVAATPFSLPPEIDELLVNLVELYRIAPESDAQDESHPGAPDHSPSTTNHASEETAFVQDVTSFLIRDKLDEGNSTKLPLETSVTWLGEAVHFLETVVTDLRAMEDALNAIQVERTEALLKTETLTRTCTELAQENKMIEEAVAAIQRRTLYFDALDDLKERIGPHPSHFVADLTLAMFQQRDNPDTAMTPLEQILTTIDESCSFFSLHQEFLEFEALRVDLLNGIRTVVTQTLDRCEAQVERKKQKTQQSERMSASSAAPATEQGSGLHFSHHYTLFRAGGQNVKPLIEILHMRSKQDMSTVYSDSLDFLEGYYTAMRLRLLADVLRNQLNVTESDGLALAVRQAVTFVLSVAQLEIKTYYSIFVPRGSANALETLLTSLGEILPEIVRPVVFASGSLHALRDMAEALSLDVLELFPQNEKTGAPPDASTANLSTVYSFVFQLHKDVQERLIFKAEMLVLTSIRGFEATSEHLAYPKILFVPPGPPFEYNIAAEPTATKSIPASEKNDSNQPRSPCCVALDPLHAWYPPMLNLIECLSIASEVVSPPAFQALAQVIGASLCALHVVHEQHAVEACLSSLFDAADRLSTDTNSKFDADLFLIKHLLMLREQVSAFHCDLVRQEIVYDFASAKSRVKALLGISNASTAAALENAATLGGAFGYFMPVVQESRVDTRRDLEVALKQHCEAFVAQCSALVLLPLLRLSSLLLEAQRRSATPSPVEEGVSQASTFGTVSKHLLHQHIAQFQTSLRQTVPRVMFNLDAYLTPTTPASTEPCSISFIPFPDDTMEQPTDVLLEAQLPSNATANSSTTPLTPSEDGIPSMRSASAQVVLFTAMKISILDVVRHIQNAVLSFSHFVEEDETLCHVTLEELRTVYGWWTPEEVTARFEKFMERYDSSITSLAAG